MSHGDTLPNPHSEDGITSYEETSPLPARDEAANKAGSLTGSLARAQSSTPTPAFVAHKRPTRELHKGKVTPIEPGDAEIHMVSENSSVSANFPNTINHRDQPHGLQLMLGALPATLTQVSDRHAFLTAAEAEGSFPRKMTHETSRSFTLTICGQEILVEAPSSIELPQDPEAFTEEDLNSLEELLAKLPHIDPRNADYVKRVAVHAKDSSERRAAQLEAENAQTLSRSATQVQIARVKGKNPKTNATEWGVAIVPYLYGTSKVYQTRIDGQPQENPPEVTESGTILFDPEMSLLLGATSKQAHATIEITGDGTVTVVGGDGYGRSSTENSAVRRF